MVYKRFRPRRDSERMAWLDAAVRRVARAHGDGHVYEDEARVARLLRLPETFEAALSQKQVLRGERRTAVNDSTEAIEQLKQLLRQARTSLKNSIARGDLSPAGQAFYAWGGTAVDRNPGTYAGWLNMGQVYVQGNQLQIQKGNPPILDPPPERLAEAVARAEETLATTADAKAAEADVDEQLRGIREQIHKLHGALARMLISEQDGPRGVAMRKLLREYGYRFVREDGPDEDEAVGT